MKTNEQIPGVEIREISLIGHKFTNLLKSV